MISVSARVDQYLIQREAFGTSLSASAIYELRKFAAFAVTEGAEHLTTELFLRWKARQPGAANLQSWACRLSHVRTFARWLQALDPQSEVPAKGLIPTHRRRPRPYRSGRANLDSLLR